MTAASSLSISQHFPSLKSLVREARWRDQPEQLAAFNREWRGNYQGAARLVLLPSSTSETSAILDYCHRHAIGWVVQGGNSGLVGGTVATEEEILISTQAMAQLISISPEALTITVEAGMTLAAVQAAATQSERQFPLSLASEGSCQIGGTIATNAGGMQVLRYGMMRNLVLGLEVVLRDGTVLSDLRGLRKANTGLDWKQLFIGSEGQFGIITKAVLRLVPMPRQSITALLALPSATAALTALAAIQQNLGEVVTSFELMNFASFQLAVTTVAKGNHPFTELDQSEFIVLLIAESVAGAELIGDFSEAVQRQLLRLVEAGTVRELLVAQSESQAITMRKLRESISDAQAAYGASLKHDISLPMAAIDDFLSRAAPLLLEFCPNLRIIAFGHLGDGNIHYNLSQPPEMTAADFKALEAPLARIIYDLVTELGGSYSAEHGIGKLRRNDYLHYTDPAIVEFVTRISQAARMPLPIPV